MLEFEKLSETEWITKEKYGQIQILSTKNGVHHVRLSLHGDINLCLVEYKSVLSWHSTYSFEEAEKKALELHKYIRNLCSARLIEYENLIEKYNMSEESKNLYVQGVRHRVQNENETTFLTILGKVKTTRRIGDYEKEDYGFSLEYTPIYHYQDGLCLLSINKIDSLFDGSSVEPYLKLVLNEEKNIIMEGEMRLIEGLTKKLNRIVKGA